MGVPAARVETPDEVAPAIERALAADGPFLIDLLLHQEVPDHDEDATNRRPVAGTRAHS
jgi:thiamine pyrophosphate-dependent acetolactate synthase large subunit-like protein